MTTTLVIGQPAPDFELVNHHGEKVTLSSFQGKQNVVLVFYPFAFSGTCTGELCALRDDISAFQNENVQVLGIACDPMYSARAFAEAKVIHFQFWRTSGRMVKFQNGTVFSLKSADSHHAAHSSSTRQEFCVGRS